MASTIFYLLCFFVCFSGFFVWKKTDAPEPGMTHLPLTGILIACFEAFLAALLGLVSIPINLWTLGIFCLLVGGFFWFRVIRFGERQRYYWNGYDLALSAALVLVVLIIANIRYGLPALDWSYRTVDPAARYREAMEYINGADVSRMFFAQLVNGTTMELFTPPLRYDYNYRLYVLSDILQLLLSGFMFYGAARRWTLKNEKTDHFASVAAILCTFFFLLGYPLNSTLYGFTYLGMSLYLVAATLVVTDLSLQEKLINRWFSVASLMLLMHAIFQCYLLFMPAVYLAVGLSYLWAQKRRERLLSKETILTALAIFALPLVLGFAYTYMDVFVRDNVTVGGAIAAEGSIYRDLYSNFIFFLPPALFGLIALYREKKNRFLSWFTPIFLVFMVGMFAVSFSTGKISTYYYFKTYYLLWLVVFLLIVYAIHKADFMGRAVVTGFLCSWIFVAAMFVTGAEFRIQGNSDLFVPDRKSERYNDLLAFNLETLKRPHYSDKKMELMHYVYGELLSTGVTARQVPVCSTEEETYLYESVTGQRLKDYEFWRSEENDLAYFENVANSCDYVCIFTDCPLYEVHKETFWDGLTVVYSNEAGFIAEVQ